MSATACCAACAGTNSAPARWRLAAKRCAGAPSPASRKALEKRGAVYDVRAKEVRATDECLRKAARGKRALKLGMEELARLGFLLAGDAPGKWLRQVRYPDGRLRVARFKPEVLGFASADQPGDAGPQRRGEGGTIVRARGFPQARGHDRRSGAEED